MKINDKTLVSFYSSNTPSDRQGWLVKRGEFNKAFQKRWCVLKGNLLFYSEKKGDREPMGVVILEGCTVELAEEETDFHAFKVIFHGDGKTSGRVYIFGTDSMEDLEAWMKLIACASYDYMKLMVMELQQQLSELEERDEQQQQLHSQGPPVPPRSRTNPFNTSGSSGKPKLSWAEIHKNFGVKIIADRKSWESKQCTSVTMEEDRLLVVL